VSPSSLKRAVIIELSILMLFLAGSLYFLVVPVTWKPLYGEIERISYPGCSYVVSRHSQPKNPYSDSSDYYSVLVDLEVSNLGDLNAMSILKSNP